MKRTAIVLLTAILLGPVSLAQPENGFICVAPISKDWPATAGLPSLICASNNFSLKIDDQKAFTWPTKESVRIDGLNLGARHRVAIYCDGKPQQSFTFRFSDFKSTELCLFLNDFYKTAQLWDPTTNRAPWCRCKRSVVERTGPD